MLEQPRGKPLSQGDKMESRLTRLDYCQFLLSSQVNYTLTHFAEHSRRFSHDLANRYLARERITPRLVWENVRGQVTPSARAASSSTTRCWTSPTQAASLWCAASTAAMPTR